MIDRVLYFVLILWLTEFFTLFKFCRAQPSTSLKHKLQLRLRLALFYRGKNEGNQKCSKLPEIVRKFDKPKLLWGWKKGTALNIGTVPTFNMHLVGTLKYICSSNWSVITSILVYPLWPICTNSTVLTIKSVSWWSGHSLVGIIKTDQLVTYMMFA